MAYSVKLQEIIDAVQLLTGRTDQEEAIVSTTQKVILRLHAVEDFQEDLVSQLVRVTSGFSAQISSPLMARKLVGVSKVIPDSFSPTGYTESSPLSVLVEMKDILSSLGNGSTDLVYDAGYTLQVRSSTREYIYLLKYYRYPEVQPQILFSHLPTAQIASQVLAALQQ